MDRFEEQEIKEYLKKHLKLEKIYKYNADPVGMSKEYLALSVDGDSLGEIPLNFW